MKTKQVILKTDVRQIQDIIDYADMYYIYRQKEIQQS